MQNKKAGLYLIEDFAPGVVKDGDKIVAVSPEAACALDSRGIGYAIVEDFCGPREMIDGEDAYFREQLEWFGRFDTLLKKNIPYCAQEGLKLATAHYFRVKFFVDTLVMYSRVFSAVFDKNAAGDVLYLRKNDEGAQLSLYAPFAAQKAVLCPLASRLAGKKGIKFSVIDIPQDIPAEAPALLGKEGLKRAVKALYLRAALRAVRYEKWSIFRRGKAESGAVNILSLHAGCMPQDGLIKDVIKGGGRAFLKEGRSILLVNDPLEKEVVDAGSLAQGYEAIRIRRTLESVFEEFMKDRALAGWISEKCGVDVSGIIRPYFEDLFLNVFFENLADLPVLKEFFDRERIDFVVTRSSSEKECVSSLLAAAASKKRVCTQHACGAYECKHDHVMDMALFDHYFAMHSEAEEQAKAAAADNPGLISCGVYQAPHQIMDARKKFGGKKRDISTVLYVPVKVFLGFCCFNGARYPVAWYYKFQKALVDLFVSRKDLKFIFKHAAGQDWAEGSILAYVKQKGADNIVIDRGPLLECLGKAGRAIVDYPATSLYEVAAADIPVLGLYSDMLKITPTAQKLFGRSLRMFSDIPEAMRTVDSFLSADPAAYKVDIPMRETDVVGVLRGIKAGRGAQGA